MKAAVTGLSILVVIILAIIFLAVLLVIFGQMSESVCNICKWICKPMARVINKIPLINPIKCELCGVC
ncbi:MAG: hypothetical protein QXQ40_01135 [Candidatus Aenigmatarchaeota archaeon]